MKRGILAGQIDCCEEMTISKCFGVLHLYLWGARTAKGSALRFQ